MLLLLLLLIAKPKGKPRLSCYGTTCGHNAICKSNINNITCVCKPNYLGDPYIGCRPRCTLSAECARSFACVNSECIDPCKNACGLRARCRVVNHSPICFCPNGMTGNPLTICNKISNCKHAFFRPTVIKNNFTFINVFLIFYQNNNIKIKSYTKNF